MAEREPSAAHGSKIVPLPRRIPFQFPDDVQPRWKAADPEFCAMVNGASLSMPYLEPFLIRSVREACAGIDDAFVQESARAFNQQEQQHFQTHRRFNELLKAKGYAELARIEQDMQAYYARLSRKSLRTRMAYTAGFEAMTLGVTRWLVENRVRLFGGRRYAGPRPSSFGISSKSRSTNAWLTMSMRRPLAPAWARTSRAFWGFFMAR